MSGGFWDGAEVISAYTRTQAIEDGTLTDLAALTPDEPLFGRQAGYLCGVALTQAVTAIVIPNDAEQAHGQDLKGRLWDLLNMSRMHRPRPVPDEGATWLFKCIFYMNREGYRRSHITLTLKANIGPGDHGEPIVTFMLQDED